MKYGQRSRFIKVNRYTTGCHSEAKLKSVGEGELCSESLKKTGLPRFRWSLAMTGFTLAEVLITLSILGVVAAISIPNLIRSYEKSLTVTKLKIAYANLEKAAANIRISTGCMNQDITCAINAMGGKSATEENFAQKFIEYSGFSDMTKQPTVHIYKFSDKNSIWTFYKGFYMSNKNKIKYAPKYGEITTKNGYYADKGILVEVVTNTKKAISGKNHFSFLIYDNFIVEPASKCFGSAPCPMSLNATSYTCPNNMGYSCLEKIIKDGWKITYW